MINFLPSRGPELKPRITVIGVGGAGGNAVNNMIASKLEGVEFIVANTDAQSLAGSRTERRIQLGTSTTQGLGAGSRPDIGRTAAEESLDEIMAQLTGSNMVFITAGMGGGTGTGAAPVIARAARENGILTVGVVTRPFQFEGNHRMRTAEAGIEELHQYVDTLIIIPNQNLFRVASERTTFADAFKMADDVLYSGVRGVTDLMIMPGLINLDFADIRTVMSEMGKAMMGTGEAEGEKRALDAAEAAISNPLLDDTSMKGARGVLINITGGMDMTLFEVDEAANRIRDEVDPDANIIFGSTFDEKLSGRMRVSVVATGIESESAVKNRPNFVSLADAKKAAQQPVVPAPAPAERSGVTPPPGYAFRPQPAAVSLPPRPQPMQAPAAAVAHKTAPAIGGFAQAVAQAPAAAMPNSFADLTAVDPALIAPRHETQGSLAVETRPQHPLTMPEAPQRPMVVAERKPEPAAEPRRAPGLLERMGMTRRQPPAPPKPAAPEPVAAPVPSAQAPRLHGPDRNDRLPQHSRDEDMLDIPAFLRRQAN